MHDLHDTDTPSQTALDKLRAQPQTLPKGALHIDAETLRRLAQDIPIGELHASA